MINSIGIEFDSEKKPRINFVKGVGSPIPQNHEEATPMIINDIKLLTEALVTLIDVADQNDYAEKDVLVSEAIATLQAYKDLKE